MILPDSDVLITLQRAGYASEIAALGRLPLIVTDTVWDEVRERVKIRSASQGVEAPGWQGVKRENIAGYLTDEQRSQPGWIGVPSAEFILTRSLTIGAELRGAPRQVVVEMEEMLIATAGQPKAILPETPEAETLTRLLAPPPTEGPGELSVIAFAYRHPDTVPVLMDRRALRRAVEEVRLRILSLHGFLDILQTEHGLDRLVADRISTWYCKRNVPVRKPIWWQR